MLQQPAQLPRPSASRSGPLSVADNAAAEPDEVTRHPARQGRYSASRPGPCQSWKALEPKQSPRRNIRPLRRSPPDPILASCPRKDRGVGHAAMDARKQADAVPTPAMLVPVARADPLDQKGNALYVAPMVPAGLNTAQNPASQPTLTTRCAPAKAGVRQAAPSQDDVARLHQDTRNDSPLKNETGCFCDGSTFLYFGCLLRPAVLAVKSSASSSV